MTVPRFWIGIALGPAQFLGFFVFVYVTVIRSPVLSPVALSTTETISTFNVTSVFLLKRKRRVVDLSTAISNCSGADTCIR